MADSPDHVLDDYFPPSKQSKYCIVLYQYIYIALLAVNTNQKRFQCERPRERRAVLRERKEPLGSPVNKVDRVEGRSCGIQDALSFCRRMCCYSAASMLRC